MDVEFKLKDLKSLNATSIKGSTNAQYGVESDLNEWMYGLCRRVVPVQCVYALPECLHDHIIAGLYIENTAANTAVRFYGLKTPSVFQKPIEVLRLFEKEFPDDVGWFNQCSGWAVRRSEAEGFVDINEGTYTATTLSTLMQVFKLHIDLLLVQCFTLFLTSTLLYVHNLYIHGV